MGQTMASPDQFGHRPKIQTETLPAFQTRPGLRGPRCAHYDRYGEESGCRCADHESTRSSNAFTSSFIPLQYTTLAQSSAGPCLGAALPQNIGGGRDHRKPDPRQVGLGFASLGLLVTRRRLLRRKTQCSLLHLVSLLGHNFADEGERGVDREQVLDDRLHSLHAFSEGTFVLVQLPFSPAFMRRP